MLYPDRVSALHQEQTALMFIIHSSIFLSPPCTAGNQHYLCLVLNEEEDDWKSGSPSSAMPLSKSLFLSEATALICELTAVVFYTVMVWRNAQYG